MITICTATLVPAATGRPLSRAGLKRQSRTARTTGSVSAGKPLITSTEATRPSAATLTRTTTVPPWNTNGEIFASTVVSGTGSSKPDSCTGDDAAVAPTTKSEANRTARRRPGVESIGETPLGCHRMTVRYDPCILHGWHRFLRGNLHRRLWAVPLSYVRPQICRLCKVLQTRV